MTTSSSLALGIQLRSALIQVGAALVVVAYLWLILTPSSAEWAEMGWAVALVCVLSGLAWPFTQKPFMQPVLDAADAFEAGDPSPEMLRTGLAGASSLPPKLFMAASTSWVLAALLVPIWMSLRLDATPGSVLGTIAAAALGGGLLSCIAAFFAVKRLVSPVRDRCASEISDPDERASLVFRVPLALKLAVASTAIVLVSLFFMIQLAWTETSKPLETHAIALKARYLEALQPARGAAALRAGDVDAAREELQAFGIAEALLVLPAHATSVTPVTAGPLDDREVAFIRSHGPSGDSEDLVSENVFAWTTLGEGGPVLVATSSAAALRGGLSKARLRYLGVLVAAILASFAVSSLVSSDVARSLERLRERAAQVAAGDLTDDRAFESEDEMGDLGREVDRMIASLRETLDQVTRTAGQVDSGASAMAGIGESVKEASAAQALALESGAREVASIDREIGGIKDSAHALTGNVEEASSSILELGAAGEELNHTASALTKQIESVSGSIEQMIISSRQIAENTDGLAQEVSETSESMGEMAASMDAVDRSAGETAALSEQVSELAGRGRDRVRETIEGMDDIRDATDTVSDTIGGLDARIQEIGAIVDVIDDVADETNLLALNAAIIAAQAGDQGRAFSVVADEIKDLADRVLRSTKEIGSLIRSVQSESGNAASAIARGSVSVQRGVELAAEAGVSLEEITTAAGTSRERIRGIVAAVEDQSRAASHVVGLMERVNLRVDEMRRASADQERGNEVIMRGSLMMRDVAQQTHRTTEEQARGARQVRQSIEGIQEAVDQIHRSLEGQAGASRSAVASLQRVHEKTASNREATDQMSQATEGLREQAQILRDDVGRFRVA